MALGCHYQLSEQTLLTRIDPNGLPWQKALAIPKPVALPANSSSLHRQADREFLKEFWHLVRARIQ